jgi:endonuclease/exonuclease/phosphatase family metal-dependent hydrolase
VDAGAPDGSVPSDVADGGDVPDGGSALLRIATFNMLSGILAGQTEERLALATAELLALDADFIALQEVTNGPLNGNIAEALAASLDMHWIWEATHEVLVYEEGPALLSRWPIASPEAMDLPHGDLGGLTQRAIVGATLATPFGSLRMAATHMTISDDETVKADQAKVAHDFVVNGLDGGLLGFMAGDLNATPDMLAMRFLRGAESHDGALGMFDDAWDQSMPGDPGLTFPADAPDRRIDYIYFTPSSALEPLACQTFGEVPDGDLFPSDHLGVLCEFRLTSP